MVYRSLIALTAFVAIPAAAAAQEPRTPVIVTRGEGIVRAVPDRAFVTITAESRAKTPSEAQRQNAKAMEDVLARIRALGIPAEAIQTRQYELTEEFDYLENRRVSRGFIARNSVEVRVDDLNRIGEVLDKTVQAGATMVGGVRFDIKKREDLEREALRLAVADARARAEAVATGAGRAVDQIMRIQEDGVVVPLPGRRVTEMRMAAADASAAPPIEAGEMEIRASVTLTVSIK
jgi:uncharacterized protein YggE